ncbi:MAG: DUF1778 domain-containing protein [Candidatus Symbiobacter sp.]|nr:DUF1778 domain-containing protein [Candidatus Symbiobacter sp.]
MSRKKSQSLDIRISPEMKAFIKLAADLTDRNLSQFVIDSVMLIAEEVINSRMSELEGKGDVILKENSNSAKN